jgi:NAD(P)-dependent dehydrogenase (short-subunit alcohol dehydrogenase family)
MALRNGRFVRLQIVRWCAMAEVVLVTGAFGSLGRATVAALRARGHRVVGLDKSAAPPPGFIAEVVLPHTDLGDDAGVENAVAQACAAGGRLRGLVNIAGGFAMSALAATPPEAFADMFRLNVATALRITRAVAPVMAAQGGGSIVNIGAASARDPGPGMAAYAGAKAALATITTSLAAELKPAGVRVNAVLPTILDTPANRRDMPDADPSAWVKPDDAAQVIAFLISDDARAVSGAHILLQ